MVKFKPGDKVRRLPNQEFTLAHPKPGEVCTVSEATGGRWISLKEYPNNPDCFRAETFELVSRPAAAPEVFLNKSLAENMRAWVEGADVATEEGLQMLVDIANAGSAAARKLRDTVRPRLEVRHPNGSWVPAHEGPIRELDYRLKPKQATFEPFTLPDSGYRVELMGKSTVSVGCAQEDINSLVAALTAITKGGYSVASITKSNGRELKAKRCGVWHNRGTLSWQDADLLLARLEDFLKKKEAA